MDGMTRREFVGRAAAGLAAAAWGCGGWERAVYGGEEKRMSCQRTLPRWRGFNLLEMFTTESDGNWREDDFRWMSGWGFDFVRLPMCYTLWIEGEDPLKLHEPGLEKVDRGVELGRKYGLHVCLNFHRGPGYSVNAERKEPYNLWKDQEALDAFCLHWRTFAERYKGIGSSELSFNLINEPAQQSAEMTREDHERVIRATVGVIREVDPDRLIVIDGLEYGRIACPELADLGVAQSVRAYSPAGVSHYRASWVDDGSFAEPVWPDYEESGRRWNREALEEFYGPWVELAEEGVGVHCGEGGAFTRTGHEVVLAWLRDVLEVLTSHNIGYALWNLRGAFGIVDSGRGDVEYEDFHGHKLDRELLSLLQEF